jgi:hypothetical protein
MIFESINYGMSDSMCQSDIKTEGTDRQWITYNYL